VRAEYENELTELIEREPFIREREKTRKGSGRVVGADGDQTSLEKILKTSHEASFSSMT
jgi:hypothetical protein